MMNNDNPERKEWAEKLLEKNVKVLTSNYRSFASTGTPIPVPAGTKGKIVEIGELVLFSSEVISIHRSRTDRDAAVAKRVPTPSFLGVKFEGFHAAIEVSPSELEFC
jgi:hypothetical protein